EAQGDVQHLRAHGGAGQKKEGESDPGREAHRRGNIMPGTGGARTPFMAETARPADSLRSLVRRPRILRALRRLDRLIAIGEQRVVEGNGVTVLAGGKAAFHAVEEAIHRARTSIAIEMYTWADDEV